MEEPVSDTGKEPTPSRGGGDFLPVFTRRSVIQTVLVVALLIAAIYFLLPKLVGLGEVTSKLGDAEPVWVAVAVAFEIVAFATYVGLFRGVVGGDVLPLTWREAYEINMAGLAATRFFSAGGAGGIALTYWALRKAGMPRRESAARMVAFLALQYIWYPIALIVCGVLLRTGVLSGENSVEVTIVPAAVAAIVIALAIAIALIPNDIERRIARFAQGHRRAGLARRLATVPATASHGLRTAFDLVGHPSRGGLAVAGAIGFWAANIAILWASFRAFGVSVPVGVVIQGFFLGMIANLIPFAPGGRRSRGRGDDRRLPAVRGPRGRGLPGRPHLPGDRLLAADPARDRRLLPAAAHGRSLGAGGAACGDGRGGRRACRASVSTPYTS